MPGIIKLVRKDGTLAIMEVDSETGDNPELCRFDSDSDFSEAEAGTFLKAVVKLWNDQF